MEMTFEQWMSRVNTHIAAKAAGLTADDLPDWRYHDAYKNGETPKSAARQAIKYAMTS